MHKKAINMIITLGMLIALLPLLTTPASAITMKTIESTLELWRNSGEGWSWNAETATLTLSGANINIKREGYASTKGIDLPANSTIILKEGTTTNINFSGVATGTSQGIYARGDLTIGGKGALIIHGGIVKSTDSKGGGHSSGIYAEGSINIESGTIASKGGQVTATSISVNHDFSFVDSYGIIAEKSININGGIVTGESGAVAANRNGNGHFAVKGKTVGIYAKTGGINIYGGFVQGAGNKASLNNLNRNYEFSFGIYSSGPMNISGGTVTAHGGWLTYGNYNAAYGIYANDTLTISDGLVTARGGNIESNSVENNNSYGIYAKKAFTVSGGILNATSESTSGNSYAIYANETFNVTNGSVNALSRNFKNGGNNYPIYANGDISISNGTVLAKSDGIYDTVVKPNYGIFGNSSILLSGGVTVVNSGSAPNARAMNKAPTLLQMKLLTGAEDNKYAAYAPSGNYYVMDSTISNLYNDATGLNVSGIPADAGEHILWDDTNKVLTLKNVIINADTANITEDSYGIVGDISKIVYEGINIVRGGATQGDKKNSYGIYSASGLTINQGPDTNIPSMLMSFSGSTLRHSDATAAGIYSTGNLDILSSTVTAAAEFSKFSAGIFTKNGDTTFEDSAVTAIGHNYGVYSINDTNLYTKTLTINNGTTIAIANFNDAIMQQKQSWLLATSPA